MADDLDKYYVIARPSLAPRKPGKSAQEKADELRDQAPVRAVISHLMGVHTDERAWRRGASGERRVATILRELPKPEWHVFNDLPIGASGANIDHLVIGPAGVYTLNTKNLTGNVWVAERAFFHNGKKTAYLPKAVQEGKRASAYLTNAVGKVILVHPVLAILVDEMKVKAQPSDVAVVRGDGLRRWLLDRPVALRHEEIWAIARAADDPVTWRSTRPS